MELMARLLAFLAALVAVVGLVDVAASVFAMLQARRHHREQLDAMGQQMAFHNFVALRLAQIMVVLRMGPARSFARSPRRFRRRPYQLRRWPRLFQEQPGAAPDTSIPESMPRAGKPSSGGAP